ncbi:MAG: Xaa-Pro peptidase family protein [Kiritimatiellae bacterium]|jgi:Xaa-Pro dipeptidase|nr:Xaa-Pro peptidase family protein [Kiritimatiellia bacterium]
MNNEKLIPKTELDNRLNTFRENLTQHDPNWTLAVVMAKINIFYFTGTMQNGILVIPRNANETFFVHRSFERAMLESNIEDIRNINSFRDIPESFWTNSKSVYLETERIPLAHYARLNKYANFSEVKPVENIILQTRAIKSELEIDFLRHAGKVQSHVLEDIVPELLQTGMSETDLASQIQMAFIQKGGHGICRVRSFGSELYLGQVCFGESALYPNPFNGPGGVRGLSPAAPIFASPECTLNEIQIISADCGSTFHGYHTDKTATYAYGAPLSQKAIDAHKRCIDIQIEAKEKLVPGAIAEEIYNSIIAKQPKSFLEIFMGIGCEQAKFLGHGVGLEIDEYPVITSKWPDTIKENMVIAIEPKAWIRGEGMVGTENTYLVNKTGAECITGNEQALITVIK